MQNFKFVIWEYDYEHVTEHGFLYFLNTLKHPPPFHPLAYPGCVPSSAPLQTVIIQFTSIAFISYLYYPPLMGYPPWGELEIVHQGGVNDLLVPTTKHLCRVPHTVHGGGLGGDEGVPGVRILHLIS